MLEKVMLRTEQISVALFVISFVLNFLLVPVAPMVINISMVTLAVVFAVRAYGGFVKFELKSANSKTIHRFTKISLDQLEMKFGGWGLSVTTLGILFSTMIWPGGRALCNIGAIAISITTVILMVRWRVKKTPLNKPLLYRILVISAFLLLFLVIPLEQRVRFKYRDYPDYAEAIINAHNHPCEQHFEELEETRRIMYENQ